MEMYLENHVNGLDMDSIRKVLELAERNEIPNGTFSDLECNLWSMATAMIEHVRRRNEVIVFAYEYYYEDNEGKYFTGEHAVKCYERAKNVTCVNTYDLDRCYKHVIPKEYMTPEMLLKANQKLEAIRLYRERNNCTLMEAKMWVERLKV